MNVFERDQVQHPVVIQTVINDISHDLSIKVKVKVTFLCRHREKAQLKLVSICHLVLEKRMWSVPRSGRFILGYDPALYKKQGAGVSRTILDVSENPPSSPLGFYHRISQPGASRYTVCPIQSLYRLPYPVAIPSALSSRYTVCPIQSLYRLLYPVAIPSALSKPPFYQ